MIHVPGRPDPGHAGTLRVLVADDSAVVRAVIGGHLRSAGHAVEEARDGREALTRLEAGALDVIVTDLQMPGADGLAVLEAVRAKRLDVEVVILTGVQDLASAVRALRLGAHDYLTKPPSNPEEVVLTVERAAEKKRLREQNEHLLKELEALSRIDPLTGLLNRRVLDESLRDETLRSRRYGFPVSFVILDLDHFKAVNDKHGHPAGDAVLKAFARLARSQLRESDALHRYGGEEFAILLAHTPLEGALEAACRVIKATRETPVAIGSKELRVTVSAGVACLAGKDCEAAKLVTQADAALYDAKGSGRDRAVAVRPTPAARRQRT